MNVNTVSSNGYFKQLDSLRTIAVIMVICSHWIADYHSSWFNGRIGVQLFFIISGFLITGILLDARSQAKLSGIGLKKSILKSFYIRRFLRIFPLFYATLALLYLMDFPSVRYSIKWHLLYLQNFLYAINGSWEGEISHFWTLAVEEQFYLIWPLFIIFTPKRFLLPLILIVILSSPLFRFIGTYLFNINKLAIHLLPFSSLDALGLGSLLALLQKNHLPFTARKEKALNVLLILSICSFISAVMLRFFSPPEHLAVISVSLWDTLIALVLLGIVYLSSKGFTGPFKNLLELPPLLYLGKISYGIYIFHNFIPTATSELLKIWGISNYSTAHPYIFFTLNLTVLIGISSLSWHFFEKKINIQKHNFPYLPSESGALAKAVQHS